MPSTTPIDLHTDHDASAAAALDKVRASVLDVDNGAIETWTAGLLSALGNVIRNDDTLTDELVRLRNLHPEVSALIASSSGWQPKDSVAVATTANITLSGEQTIDGVLTSASRILVKNQTLGQNNGIYTTGAGAWTRATDADTAAELGYSYAFVTGGTTQSGTSWVCNQAAADITTLGTTPLTFSQVSGYTASPAMVPVIRALTTALGMSALGINAVNHPMLAATTLDATRFALGNVAGAVDSIAALKALAAPTAGAETYQVRGYYAAGDGGGGFFWWSSASSATDDGGSVIRPDSLPATGRWLRIVDQSAGYNVKWFGAKGDGATDDTAAIQAAINKGGLIIIPKSTYVVSAALNVSIQGTSIAGSGRNGTWIYQTTNNAYIFNVTAQNCEIYDLSLDYTPTPIAGAVAVYSSGANNQFTSIQINKCYIGFQILTGSSQQITQSLVYSYVSAGIYMTATGDCVVDNCVLDAVNTTNGALGGIYMANFVEAAQISNVDILNGVYSLQTGAASYVAGSRPAYCVFSGVYFDGSAQGSLIDKMVATSFDSCWWSAGRTGGGYNGLVLAQCEEIAFTACKFVGCGSNGAFIGASATRCSFINCKAQGNAVTTGAGTSAGLQFDAGSSKHQIIGGFYGNSTIWGGTQGTGISFAGTNDKITVIGADLTNNSVDSMYENGLTASTIRDCKGFNPVGGSAPTVGASPWTYTAGPSGATLYIIGGTITSIVVAGQTVDAATKTIELGPNDAAVITYSVAPTARVNAH